MNDLLCQCFLERELQGNGLLHVEYERCFKNNMHIHRACEPGLCFYTYSCNPQEEQSNFMLWTCFNKGIIATKQTNNK